MTGFGVNLEEPVGVARHGEVVRFGVPFRPGVWREDTAPAVRATGDGQVVGVLDHQVEQRWPDGTVKLMFVAVAVDLQAQGRARLEVERGEATETPEGGAHRTQAASRGREGGAEEAPAPRGDVGGMGCDLDAVLAALEATVQIQGETPRTVTVEGKAARPGVVGLRGGPTPEGLELTGVLACAARDAVVLRLTMANVSTAPVALREVVYAIDLSVLLGGTPPVRLRMGEAYAEWEGRCTYLQLGGQGQIQVDGEAARTVQALGRECRLNRVWAAADAGQRVWTFAVRNLLENFPARLDLDASGLRFAPWPCQAVPAVLAPGMSKTYEIGICAGAQDIPPHHAALAFQYPLAPQPALRDLAVLRCFPDTAEYRPADYPRLETWIKWMIGNRPRAYGWRHFGDEPNHGYTARGDGRILWTNNEYDYPLVALSQFLRAGDRIAWEDGRAAVLHMMDIDSIVADADPDQVGGQHSHSPDHVTHPAAPDHEWLEGLLLYYLLTDDSRALERARALADRLLRLTRAGEFDDVGKSPRRYGWTVIALCSMHGFTGEDRYLEAAGRIVRTMLASEEAYGGLRWKYWDAPYEGLDGFMVGVAGAGLCRYHAFTQDEQVEQAIVRTCDALLSLAAPEGILHYKEFPLVRLSGDISGCLVLEVLACGYRLTGNREYLLCGARNAEHALQVTESGLMITWNAEQRVPAEGGVYLRETVLTPDAQMIGLMLRGIWPFLEAAHEAGIFTGPRNPFLYACDRQ